MKQLADLVGGTLHGPDRTISGVQDLQNAHPEHLTFLANQKYRHFLQTTRAGGILLEQHYPEVDTSQIVVSNPYYAYARIMWQFYPSSTPAHPESKASIDPTAQVDPSAVVNGATIASGAMIESGVVLYPGVYIGSNVHIGPDSQLFPGVVVYAGCRLGARVIVHANTVLGSDGYGYATHQGQHHKIPHIGTLTVEDDVEIGAACAIDRGVLGEARIGKGCKIDNLVHIGHNCSIGEHCLITAQCGFAGSATLGDNVVFGGQCGVNGHISITSDSMFVAKSGVTKNIDSSGVYAGFPAVPQKQWQRESAALRRLESLNRRVQKLESQLEQLQEKPSHEN
nr:UDP-3-O-(3-hydroxymyristoyl)glucosamine N-acyltransferase [Desulfurispira natronophila]